MSQNGSISPTQIPSEALQPKEVLSNELQLEEISSEESFTVGAKSNELSQLSIRVVVPPVQERWRYQIYHENRSVDEILEEIGDPEGSQFRARLSDGIDVTVSYY